MRLALTTALSQAFVALAIESDAVFEESVEHVTTDGGERTGAPWLTSAAMWFSCLRFVDEDGITAGDLARRTRLRTNVHGMRRWGLVSVDGSGVGAVLRPTAGGRAARAVWPEAIARAEASWRRRAGAATVDALRDALATMAADSAVGLPDYLPIVGHGLWCRDQMPRGPGRDGAEELASLPLLSLLARVLFATALAFERDAPVSLAIAANTLRVADSAGVAVADLATLTGVAKPAHEMAIGVLRKHGLAAVRTERRRRILTPTERGGTVRDRAARRLSGVESRMAELHDPDGLLAAALAALPDALTAPTVATRGWRAGARPPETLPHFPVVLHRGGYPDGS